MLNRAKLWLADSVLLDRFLRDVSATARLAGAGATRARCAAWGAEKMRFYRAFRANPKGIGAIAPSSEALALAITCDIDATTGPVIELGAGTGVFTRMLARRGVAPRDLALVEMDAQFSVGLVRDFPFAEHYPIDACTLDQHDLFGGRAAGAIVCGLPLLNMPLRQQLGIVRAAFSHLRDGGACYLFTYGWRCPVNRQVLERMGVRARKIDLVWRNVPPAHVWKLTRRGPRGRVSV